MLNDNFSENVSTETKDANLKKLKSLQAKHFTIKHFA